MNPPLPPGWIRYRYCRVGMTGAAVAAGLSNLTRATVAAANKLVALPRNGSRLTLVVTTTAGSALATQAPRWWHPSRAGGMSCSMPKGLAAKEYSAPLLVPLRSHYPAARGADGRASCADHCWSDWPSTCSPRINFCCGPSASCGACGCALSFFGSNKRHFPEEADIELGWPKRRCAACWVVVGHGGGGHRSLI